MLTSILFCACKESTTVRDINGNIYQTVKIGNTLWLAENLKATRFQNGDSVAYVLLDSIWSELKTPAFCYYDHETSNSDTFGNLYNWYVVNDDRNICPCGWEVASKEHFGELSRLYGGDEVCGIHLKDNAALTWVGDSFTDNSSGFSALPNGHRDSYFDRLGHYAFFWHKEEYIGKQCAIDSFCAYECSLLVNFNYINRDYGHKNRGMAIRCVKKVN